MKYDIKLYRGFPLSRANNYALEGGLSSIYESNTTKFLTDADPLVLPITIAPYATYTDFAPFDLNLSISLVLPSVSSDAKNIFADDPDALAINYLIVKVYDHLNSPIQYIGYYVNSQERLANSTLRVSCEADLLNSIDFEQFIDFRQSVFTRRHKSRIDSFTPPEGITGDGRATLKPIDFLPETFDFPTSIVKKTEIDPDRGLKFSMIQRAINKGTFDEYEPVNVETYPSWGIILEDSTIDGEQFLGAYCNTLYGKTGESYQGGVLSVGLGEEIKRSATISRYVKLPYCPFDIDIKKVNMTAYGSLPYFSHLGLVLDFHIKAPLWSIGVPNDLKPVRSPAIIKELPNNDDLVSLTSGNYTFTAFANETEWQSLTAEQKTADVDILARATFRDRGLVDIAGMIGFGDKGAFHPTFEMMQRDLQIVAPLSNNLSTGLRRLRTLPYTTGRLKMPLAIDIIDPKVSHSSISPLVLNFGASSCDVPLETFSDITNDDRFKVSISYSLATPGNFTLSVKPYSGQFIETNMPYHCLFSVYSSADMQLTSDSYVSYMRDQRPFDLAIQYGTKPEGGGMFPVGGMMGLFNYHKTKGMLNSIITPETVASYGASALINMANWGADILLEGELMRGIFDAMNDKKQAMAAQSSHPVITTTYDIWEGIDNYHAVVIEREPNPNFKTEVRKAFYYTGYSTLERLPSLVKTRWLFDHFRGALVLKPSLNGVAASRLIDLFSQGITILHRLPDVFSIFRGCDYVIPDYDVGYENLEADIPLTLL